MNNFIMKFTKKFSLPTTLSLDPGTSCRVVSSLNTVQNLLKSPFHRPKNCQIPWYRTHPPIRIIEDLRVYDYWQVLLFAVQCDRISNMLKNLTKGRDNSNMSFWKKDCDKVKSLWYLSVFFPRTHYDNDKYLYLINVELKIDVIKKDVKREQCN